MSMDMEEILQDGCRVLNRSIHLSKLLWSLFILRSIQSKVSEKVDLEAGLSLCLLSGFSLWNRC